MIQPPEMQLQLPMSLTNGIISTTALVWDILAASRNGNLSRVKKLIQECPELAYAQYNYTPPIHFAVREGHIELVDYLLVQGAHDPTYKIYPFLDSLVTIARDRDHEAIARMLEEYAGDPSRQRFAGDNGKIHFSRSDLDLEFQEAVDKGDTGLTAHLLNQHPSLVNDETFFWGEGILAMPAHDSNQPMTALLWDHGARVPSILKWVQEYYFKQYDMAVYLMEKGMDPNVRSWQEVRLLHDMAQKGNIAKAELLIRGGADLDPLEDEYQSTPLGLAARWGHGEMVEYLLAQGADPRKSGAAWSTPLAWAQRKGHTEIEHVLIKAGAQG